MSSTYYEAAAKHLGDHSYAFGLSKNRFGNSAVGGCNQFVYDLACIVKPVNSFSFQSRGDALGCRTARGGTVATLGATNHS
jgi:hypothetical protein